MFCWIHILSTYFYIYHTHKSQHIIHIITTININSHCHHDPMDFHSPKVTFISRIIALFMRPLTILFCCFHFFSSLLLFTLVAFLFFFGSTGLKFFPFLLLLLFNKLQTILSFYVGWFVGFETIYHMSAELYEHGKPVIW